MPVILTLTCIIIHLYVGLLHDYLMIIVSYCCSGPSGVSESYSRV